MIYLDNAATEKPDAECLNKCQSFLAEDFYNPSALYEKGFSNQLQINSARENIVSLIALNELFTLTFLSCGTEADNQAIFCGAKKGNIVTTLGEHSAVYSAVNALKLRGVEVRFAKLNGSGQVDVKDLLSLIDEKTSLVSVIHVNNETGAVNDINDVAERVKNINKNAIFHSDGVQAFGKISYRLSSNIDLYSVSAHKIGGIRGCGALIRKKSLVLPPLIYGGGQEKGLRSGTENTFAIKCFEYAAKKRYDNLAQNYKHVSKLKEEFLSAIDNKFFKISKNGSPYIVSIAAEGVRGETILHDAEAKGLLIGTGSACSSNEKVRRSRVITACGVKESLLDGVLRISFSVENSVEEVIKSAKILNEILAKRKNSQRHI